MAQITQDPVFHCEDFRLYSEQSRKASEVYSRGTTCSASWFKAITNCPGGARMEAGVPVAKLLQTTQAGDAGSWDLQGIFKYFTHFCQYLLGFELLEPNKWTLFSFVFLVPSTVQKLLGLLRERREGKKKIEKEGEREEELKGEKRERKNSYQISKQK